MVVGAGMTFVVQSSSVFTSAITPLIGESQQFLIPCHVSSPGLGVLKHSEGKRSCASLGEHGDGTARSDGMDGVPLIQAWE